MSIYEKWQEIISNQSEETFPAFWEKYSETEKRIYTDILSNYKEPFSGIFNSLTEKYETTPELFMGFFDGINSSLTKELDLNKIDENSEIKLEINFETLYYNMLEAKADYLYTLPQWNQILSNDKIKEITKAQRLSKTVIKEQKVGRNDACPCGSGKKYKKCCGAGS
ncbi:MAG: hypothetical protein GX285_04565 [Clostridiales bacterium]|nr:hypothetical protein [Clostridiales bacterium]